MRAPRPASAAGILRKAEPLRRLELLARCELASKRLRSRLERAHSPEGWIDLCFDFESGGVAIVPYQVKSELLALLELLQERPPRTVVEIGTHRGGTLFLFARVAAPDACLVTVDLWGGPFGGGYARERARLYRSFRRDRQRVELVRGDSHQTDTRDRIATLLRGREIDFLFIDGDHSYEGVKCDLELYGPLVSNDGVIAFHDIVPGPPEATGGVPRLWEELKRSSPVRELVADWQQEIAGIGVVRRGDIDRMSDGTAQAASD